MKLKNMWKRFWTLDVHNHEGFTLVELIIVIAILAILSTGAIAGYSVYIKQANMTADKALVAEVANALMLYYYANYDKVVDGYVVLTVGGSFAEENNAEIVAAMEAAFGEGWESALSLKYAGWFDGMSAADGSTLTGLDATQLSKSAAMLAGFATTATASNNHDSVVRVLSMFCNLSDDQVDELAQYKGSEDYSVIATNLMVKYLSDELADMTITQIEGVPVYTNPDGTPISAAGEIAIMYATLYSMANSNDPNKAYAEQVLNDFDTQLKDLSDRESANPSGTQVQNELTALFASLANATVEDAQGNVVQFGQEMYMPYYQTNGKTELEGIKAAMGTMSGIADNLDEEKLSDSDLFTSALIMNAINDFQIAQQNKGVVIRIYNGECSVIPEI